MQKFPGQKSIVAHFPTSNNAYEAARTLQNAGLGAAQVDQISSDGENKDPHYENPVDATLADIMPTAQSTGVGDFSTNADSLYNVTNQPSNNYGNSGYETMLTLSTQASKEGRAIEIIREYGGIV